MYNLGQKLIFKGNNSEELEGFVKLSNDVNVVLRGSDGKIYTRTYEEIEKASKYGEGKRKAVVAVQGKSGKVSLRTQTVGTKAEDKKQPSKAKDEWWSDLKEYSLSKYPVGIPKDKVEVNIEGDVDSHWVLKWKNPSTGKTELSYTKEFLNRNAQFKWKRIQDIDAGTIASIRSKSLAHLKDDSFTDKERDSAAIINIIANTGLRPGDEVHFKSTGNRGVSTLAVENLKFVGDKVAFNFTGKSHKENNAFIKSKPLVEYLKKRIEGKEAKDFVFEAGRADTIVTLRLRLGFKNLKLKDMRTYVATDKAREILFSDKSSPPPLPEDKKKIKKMVQTKLNDCYAQVSRLLNNTPAMAKNSYIHPVVVDTFLTKIGVDRTILEKSIADDEFDMTLDEIIAQTKDFVVDADIEISEADEEYVDYFNLPEWWEE